MPSTPFFQGNSTATDAVTFCFFCRRTKLLSFYTALSRKESGKLQTSSIWAIAMMNADDLIVLNGTGGDRSGFGRFALRFRGVGILVPARKKRDPFDRSAQ